MKLNILERLMLLNVLPPEGDLRTMKVVRNLRMDLALTEQEIKDWNVQTAENQVTWDDEKIEDAEINVAGERTVVVVDALKKLDSEKKVGSQHLSLFEKFPISETKG